MADEVKAPEVTAAPAEEQKATIEPKSTRGRKKGTAAKPATAKKAETKTVEKKQDKKPGPKTSAKKTNEKKPVTPKKAADKKAVASKKTAVVPTFNFAKTVFEFDKKQFTEDAINKKVLEYLTKHPYIHAEKIETFVNLEEKKIYFTVDGYGNADFSVEL